MLSLLNVFQNLFKIAGLLDQLPRLFKNSKTFNNYHRLKFRSVAKLSETFWGPYGVFKNVKIAILRIPTFLGLPVSLFIGLFSLFAATCKLQKTTYDTNKKIFTPPPPLHEKKFLPPPQPGEKNSLPPPPPPPTMRNQSPRFILPPP